MSKLTDKEWVELTRLTTEYTSQGLRMGQSYMNALARVNPKIYDQITATKNDCFYNDTLIINFMKYLNNEN